MITEINNVPRETYQYRLIYPDGHLSDKELPFFVKSGDVLILDRVYMVILVDPTTIYQVPSLFLGCERRQ